MAAVRPRELRLLRAADGADHGRAEVARPLAGDQPDAAGGRMDQHGVAGADLVGAPQQVLGGHALEHHRRRGASSMASGSLITRAAGSTRSSQ